MYTQTFKSMHFIYLYAHKYICIHNKPHTYIYTDMHMYPYLICMHMHTYLSHKLYILSIYAHAHTCTQYKHIQTCIYTHNLCIFVNIHMHKHIHLFKYEMCKCIKIHLRTNSTCILSTEFNLLNSDHLYHDAASCYSSYQSV